MNLESYFPGTNLGLRSFTGARKAGRGGGGGGVPFQRALLYNTLG